MKFIETRGNDGHRAKEVSFSQAILTPMSSFGGIYSPEHLPNAEQFDWSAHLNSDYKQLAKALLTAFEIDVDTASLDQALALYDNFDDPSNPVPVAKLNDDVYVSELYHGPTRAFKDMALQPFGVVLSAIAQARNENYLIMTATSGDTGPAAIDTFKNKANVQVACMYPEGGTSDVQRLQMVTEDANNIKVIGVRGVFDDTQAALKSLLSSDAFNEKMKAQKTLLSAANSVNFGRIIFQIVYHFHSYLELVRQGAIAMNDKVYLVVPSGNFGNALGAYYARQMGLPVEKIIIASNANNVLTDFINHGRYDIRDSSVVQTSSPAMDILVSSNIERILFDLFGAARTKALMGELQTQRHYQLSPEELAALQAVFSADYCTDAEGMAFIKRCFDNGYTLDPHTATCLKAVQTCATKPYKSIIYSTAEWTKFSPIMADAIAGESKGMADLEALQFFADQAGIAVPGGIKSLFELPIAQQTLVDKEDIEQTVLSFVTEQH